MTDELTVLYDADCGICTHTARALARLDSRKLLRLVPLQKATFPGIPPRDVLLDALHAVDANGHWSVGAEAAVEIARRVPWLWPVSAVARLPLAMSVLRALYRAVADNRQRLSGLLGLHVCQVRSREARSPDESAFQPESERGLRIGNRGVEQRQLVGLITRRSAVRIRPPQPTHIG